MCPKDCFMDWNWCKTRSKADNPEWLDINAVSRQRETLLQVWMMFPNCSNMGCALWCTCCVHWLSNGYVCCGYDVYPCKWDERTNLCWWVHHFINFLKCPIILTTLMMWIHFCLNILNFEYYYIIVKWSKWIDDNDDDSNKEKKDN
jgi:hypothetical protein